MIGQTQRDRTTDTAAWWESRDSCGDRRLTHLRSNRLHPSIDLRLIRSAHIISEATFRASTRAVLWLQKMASASGVVDTSTSQAPAATTSKRTPSDFLKGVLGRPVIVKLNSGVTYKGILACLDGYMNVAMEQTEEYQDGILKVSTKEGSPHRPDPSYLISSHLI